MGAVAVQRSAAAGRRRRRIGRAVVGQTVMTLRVAMGMMSTADAHSPTDVMKMLARLVQ